IVLRTRSSSRRRPHALSRCLLTPSLGGGGSILIGSGLFGSFHSGGQQPDSVCWCLVLWAESGEALQNRPKNIARLQARRGGGWAWLKENGFAASIASLRKKP